MAEAISLFSGRVEIPILVRDSRAGTFRTSLKAIGEGGSAVALVKAEVAEAVGKREVTRAATAAPAAKGKPDSKSDDTSDENPVKETDTPQPSQGAREIPNAFGKFARGTGPDTAVLDWPANLGPSENLRIEERVLSFSESDELKIGWSPLPGVIIKSIVGRVSAELHGLKPQTLHTIRVLSGKDADATVLFAADFWTAPKKPFLTDSPRTALLVIALCVLLFAIWRSRRAARKSVK